MDSVEYKEILKQLTSINVEIQNMGIESDRLTASIASLDTKVTAVEDFIKANPGSGGAATAAQLTAFADSVDASVARLDVAITATPVVTPPVTTEPSASMTQAEKDAKEAKDAADLAKTQADANAQNLADFQNMH